MRHNNTRHSSISTVKIAEQLNLSPRTIEVHKRNMFLKCKVRSSVELILYVLKNGFSKLKAA
ncbi:MAG: hypothetical protein COB15_14580 [Flavobacteriales bacterium]|nr:MAG: hypothetical protein COB15_14580 [Flavobacteriales bacterium]